MFPPGYSGHQTGIKYVVGQSIPAGEKHPARPKSADTALSRRSSTDSAVQSIALVEHAIPAESTKPGLSTGPRVKYTVPAVVSGSGSYCNPNYILGRSVFAVTPNSIQ